LFESMFRSRILKLGGEVLTVLAVMMSAGAFAQQQIVLTNVTVIDGTGRPAQHNRTVVIKEDRIESIAAGHKHTPSSAKVIDLEGQAIMPLIINAHGHLGLTKGITQSAANQTDDNFRHQLLRYQEYGVGAVLSMGARTESASLRSARSPAAARFRELMCTRQVLDLARTTGCFRPQWALQKCFVPRRQPKPAARLRSKFPRSRISLRFGWMISGDSIRSCRLKSMAQLSTKHTNTAFALLRMYTICRMLACWWRMESMSSRTAFEMLTLMTL